MQYPFEFDECLLTDGALNRLGFSEYWGGSGDFGERSFGIDGVELYKLVEHDSKDDENDGYMSPAKFQPAHFSQPFKAKRLTPIYFLHELYESIKENNPNLLEMFIQKAKDANMKPFLDSYLKHINK